MDLDLSDAHRDFQQRIAEFARDRIAPEAAAIDERGTFPRALVADMAALGLLGVTIPVEWGGAGLDYISYALAIEAISSVSAVLAVIAAVNNSLVAEPLAEFGTAAQKELWLRRLASGRGDWRLCIVGRARRIGRGQPAIDRAARRSGLRDQRPKGLGRQRRSCGGPRRVCVDAARHSRPRRQRVCRADGHARHHARRCRRLARRARTGLHGPRVHQRARRLGCAARDSRRRLSDRDVGARRRPRRHCRTGVRGWGGSVAGGSRATRKRAKRSVSRSGTIRRSSGCSPTWRPNSTPRAC